MRREPETATQLEARAARDREIINCELELSSIERAILNAVLDWGHCRGREWAVFETLEDIADWGGLDRFSVSKRLKDLQDAGLLHVRKRHREIQCRLLPGGVFVEPPKKVDPTHRAVLARKLEKLNSHPRGFTPQGQRLMEFAAQPSTEEAVDDELAAESRLRAFQQTLPVQSPTAARPATPQDRRYTGEDANPQPVTDQGVTAEQVRAEVAKLQKRLGSPVGDSPTTTLANRQRRSESPAGSDLSVGKSPTLTAACLYDRASVREPEHDHEHVVPSYGGHVKHDHALDAEEGKKRDVETIRDLESRLDPEQEEVMEFITELTGDFAGRYRKTWLLRCLDAWFVVQTVAGEAKHKLRVGPDPRLGWGEWLNFQFNLEKRAMRKAKLKLTKGLQEGKS